MSNWIKTCDQKPPARVTVLVASYYAYKEEWVYVCGRFMEQDTYMNNFWYDERGQGVCSMKDTYWKYIEAPHNIL